MQKINSKHTGLVLGSLFALIHLIWVIMVGAGWAKPSIDFVLGLHFISFPYVLTPFALGPAIVLVILTFVAGYVVGHVFAAIWNAIKK